jgi:hypothetical protein
MSLTAGTVAATQCFGDVGFAGTDRFEILSLLGAGGMGVVYEAYDRERARAVALKTLRHRDGTALYRFKREFRGLADISHPNLAALHDLVASGGEWFFTMELIDGVDFITWVRGEGEPSPAVSTWPERASDGSLFGGETSWQASGRVWPPPPPEPSPPRLYDRLRDALRQLAEGVHCLHRACKLHRDIKPSNVMVDRDGRVVLLDFGLVTDVSHTGGGLSDDYRMVGTVDYMSPEQSVAQPLWPASDWYAVGAMLYHALTGWLPFFGPPVVVLMEKQRREPEPPDHLVPGTPADLSQLCQDLLRREQDERPSGDEILHRLGGCIQPRARRPSLVAEPQRDAMAAVLSDSLATATGEGRAMTVVVHGPAGAGKTRLIERVAGELARERGAVVLAGRCHEREWVPCKALDGLIDSLSRHLAQLPRHEVDVLMPREVLAMSQLFPVLRRVRAVRAAPHRIATRDPADRVRRGMSGLRELLARMADRRPLVLIVDDLQWGDPDSTAHLLDLVRPPDPPAVLMVLSCRSGEAGASDAARRLIEELRAPQPDAVREVALRWS